MADAPQNGNGNGFGRLQLTLGMGQIVTVIIGILGAVWGIMQFTLASQERKYCQEFAKIETQFGTVETVLNKTQVENNRTQGLLWDKAYGQRYPDAFYAIAIPHEIEACN